MNLNYGTNEMTGGELINLLCIIHRDGGHYIQQHGLEKAYVDAVNILNRWKTLPDELETERMKVVACGVVAMANTRETAEEARKMRPEYRSASLGDVERAVDCEMQYREELTTIKEQRNEAVSAVQRLTEGQPFDAVVIADGIKRGVAATLQKAIETEHAEEQKKIVMLREALESANSALEFSSHGAVKAIHKALEATQDLSGLILCEAEPVAWMFSKGTITKLDTWEHGGNWKPLYQARKAK